MSSIDPPLGSVGGIHTGNVGGDLTFHALGDIVGGNKIVTINTTIQISVDAVTQRSLLPVSPYRALEPFKDANRDLFFGRNQLIKRLISELGASNVLVVLGASGSGKSSVVLAGLLPTLSHLLGTPFRSLILVPDSNPFESLRSSLHGAGFSQSQTALLSSADPASPLKAVQMLKRKKDQWLIFVDQFEEIFTVTEESLRPKFVEALLRIAKDAEGSTKLVLSMRADFFDRFTPYPEFAKVIEKNIDFVADMHEDELRLAIEQPAAQHGVVFEKGLAEEIIKNVQGQAGSLPLLQYTLDLLWKEELGRDGLASRHLHADTYRALGGVRGALQQEAERIYASLGNPEDNKTATAKQEAARSIFLRLVDLAGKSADEAIWKPVRRRIAKNSFVTEGEQEVLKLLIKERMLVSNREEKEEKEATVEVAHEALFTSWERLKKWIEGGKQVIFARNRLSDDSKRWEAKKQNGDASAQEELLAGSRLGQALEMRTKGDFDTILGGLNPTETHFLDASAAQREQRRHEELARHQKELEKEKQLRETEAARALERAEAQQRELEKEKQLRETEAARALERDQAAVVAKQQSKRSVRLAAVAMVAALIALLFYRRASLAGAKAERNALLSQAQTLVAEARQIKGTSPIRSLILASAAVETTRRRLPDQLVLPSAHQTLRDALANTGGQPLPAQGQEIRCMAVSRDERWLVNGCDDHTARLWDLRATGSSDQPIVLEGHHGSIIAAAFSPDNHWVATGSLDRTAKLWDLRAANPSSHAFRLAHRSPVICVAFSPNARWLITGSSDDVAQLRDLQATNPSDRLIWLSHPGSVTCAAFSPDNHWLVTGSTDRTARLWDLSQADPSASFIELPGHTNGITAVAFSLENHWIVTGSADSTARLWDLHATNRPPTPIILKGHEDSVTAVTFSPDTNWLATVSYDKTARLWDMRATDPSTASILLRGHDGPVLAAAFSHDTRWLATASEDKTARLWDLRATDPTTASIPLRGHDGPVKAVSFGPNHNSLFTGSDDRTVRLWDLRLNILSAQPFALMGPRDVINAVAFSPDSRWVVTGSRDHSAWLWDLKDTNSSIGPVVLDGHTKEVNAVGFSPDSHWIVTGSADCSARLWRLRGTNSSSESLVLTGHTGGINVAAFSANNRWLATGSEDRTAQLWALEQGVPSGPPKVLRGHDRQVKVVVFSPDSRWVATGGPDDTVRLWDLREADPSSHFVELKGNAMGISSMAFSPNNLWLITGGYDNTARLWDMRATDPNSHVLELIGHTNGITSLAVSPDNHWIVTASGDDTARLWDLHAKDPSVHFVELKGHAGPLLSLAISPDNHWVATGSQDRTARLWNLRASDPSSQPQVFQGSERAVTSVAFSEDTQWLLTVSFENTARLWTLPMEELLASARRTSGRNLSTNEWQAALPGQPYFEVFPGLPIPRD